MALDCSPICPPICIPSAGLYHADPLDSILRASFRTHSIAPSPSPGRPRTSHGEPQSDLVPVPTHRSRGRRPSDGHPWGMVDTFCRRRTSGIRWAEVGGTASAWFHGKNMFPCPSAASARRAAPSAPESNSHNQSLSRTRTSGLKSSPRPIPFLATCTVEAGNFPHGYL